MHKIPLKSIAKKFDHGYLFKDLSIDLTNDNVYAITGTNGSGKSTLLQIISGYVTPDKGRVEFVISEKKMTSEQIGNHTSMAAPAMQLFDMLTLREAIEFHFTHKKLRKLGSIDEFVKIIALEKHLNKPLKNYSSGMLQKVKLALAMYSESEILLLDEPTSNLDKSNKEWFYTHFKNCKNGRIVVIASNEKEEIALSNQQINL